MRVAFSQDKTKVLFLHENGNEYKFLHNYPAFLKEGPYFYVAAKNQVVYNVIQRLRKSRCKLNVDQSVFEFMNSPFKLKELPENFKFITEPMDYQRIALRYMYTVDSGGLLLDPGMGKSKVVLDYIKLKGFNRTLVICPKPLLFVWEDEVAVHRNDLTIHAVTTTDWESEVNGIISNDITVINYNKASLFKNELKSIGFDFIHIDEFLIKDPKTARTNDITELSQSMQYRCGGSGTLVNNTIMDVYCPVRYLEPSLVGMSYYKFQERHAVKREVERDGKKRKQIVAFTGQDEARSILESCCIVMTKDKWLKLPEKVFNDVYVKISDEQKDAYYSLMRNYITKVGDTFIEVDNPLVMMSKLYQISNGFVYHTPPEEEKEEVNDLLAENTKAKKKQKRTTLYFERNPKIEALKGLLTDTIKSKRAIIWFNMEAEYQQIKAMLDSESQSYITIKGGESKTGAKVREFNNNPNVQWLVCQAKSVNYGITVLGTTLEKMEDSDIEFFPGVSPEVHTQVFYSMNFSLEVYLQQQDRIHRLGQKHVCEYYRIFSNTPVEKRVRQAIEDKMSLRLDMLVDVMDSLLKEDRQTEECGDSVV